MPPRIRAPTTTTPTRKRRRRRSPNDAPTPFPSSVATSLLRLQATAGNAAVTRLIQKQPDSKVAKGKPAPSPPNTVPFPGEFVPGYEPARFIGVPFEYSEKDRDAFVAALKKRHDGNQSNMADFLGNYVEATLDIWGRYITSEMVAAATKSEPSFALKLLEGMLVAASAAFAGGVLGAGAKWLAGEMAGKVIGLLGSSVTGMAGRTLTHGVEENLTASDVKKRQEALDAINTALAKETGKFVTNGVKALGDDSIDRTRWLMKAPLNQLDLFRIPTEITPVDKSAIRAVVAGVIAGKTHQHDADKPCDSIGLQCGIAEIVPPGSVGELDDNVVKIGLTPAGATQRVNYLRFFTASPVLAAELVGKAQLSMVPTMALRIEADHGVASTDAGEILAASGSGTTSDPAAEDRFIKRYEQLDQQSGHEASSKKDVALLTRNPKAGLKTAGVGLTEALWLYRLATGDTSLAKLGDQIKQGSDSDGPAPQDPSPTRLAELAHAEIEPVLLAGVAALIKDHLGALVLPNVEPKGRRVAR
jgi:hypothetical protein